jgi:hypothetical protein
MEYGLDRTVHLDVGAHVVLHERERAVATQVRNVVERARDQVVEPEDLVSNINQSIRQMRAEEARRSSHHDTHQTAFLPMLT